MAGQTPRDMLRELIRKAEDGPAFLTDPTSSDTAEHQREILRLWLDSWILPELREIQRRAFPPTMRQLDVWKARQPADAQAAIMDRTTYLKDHGMRSDRAYRQAVLEAFDKWRMAIRDEARKERQRRREMPPIKYKPCRVCRGSKGLACSVCAGSGEEPA